MCANVQCMLSGSCALLSVWSCKSRQLYSHAFIVTHLAATIFSWLFSVCRCWSQLCLLQLCYYIIILFVALHCILNTHFCRPHVCPEPARKGVASANLTARILKNPVSVLAPIVYVSFYTKTPNCLNITFWVFCYIFLRFICL